MHQGIADRLPSRLEFYESWLTPEGLRNGTVTLPALVAVLSFLRTEGEPYDHVTERAGEYAARWTVESLGPIRRRILRALPRRLRARAALGVCCDLVKASYAGSRARARIRRGTGEILVRGSIFCGVREPAAGALCGFYSAAVGRVLAALDVENAVRVVACRATGQRLCLMTVALPARGAPAAPDGAASE